MEIASPHPPLRAMWSTTMRSSKRLLKNSQDMSFRGAERRGICFCLAFLLLSLLAAGAAAQEKPAEPPPTEHAMDMQHMHHEHQGGFMQGGMHHAVAKGVK